MPDAEGVPLINPLVAFSPDGATIDLNLVPQVVEFEGFINYGSPIQTTSTNALGVSTVNVITPNVINQPIFSTRKLKLGTFQTNLDSGCVMSDLDGRLEISWPNTVALAQLADEMEFEALVPIGCWLAWCRCSAPLMRITVICSPTRARRGSSCWCMTASVSGAQRAI